MAKHSSDYILNASINIHAYAENKLSDYYKYTLSDEDRVLWKDIKIVAKELTKRMKKEMEK